MDSKEASSPTTRFSSRVENYIKYRPKYPSEIIAYLEQHCDLNPKSVIADIGSGTGISAKSFLESGNRVYGVEPNDAMRAAAEKYLEDFSGFESVNGSAEATTLEENSIDLALAAQAFHWFDSKKAKNEFARILKPGGFAVLIWNERKLDATPFLIEYEAILLRHATDYEKVRHENIDSARIEAFLGPNYCEATFPNEQNLDFEGLKGRLLSSSYVPGESSPAAGPMIAELATLFAKHEQGGRISILYNTKIYHSPCITLCQ